MTESHNLAILLESIPQYSWENFLAGYWQDFLIGILHVTSTCTCNNYASFYRQAHAQNTLLSYKHSTVPVHLYLTRKLRPQLRLDLCQFSKCLTALTCPTTRTTITARLRSRISVGLHIHASNMQNQMKRARLAG